MVARTLSLTLVLGLLALPAHAQPIQIVAFGDSNTAGFRVLAKNAYPAQLERALREKAAATT